jgi:hypothetical protein
MNANVPRAPAARASRRALLASDFHRNAVKTSVPIKISPIIAKYVAAAGVAPCSDGANK